MNAETDLSSCKFDAHTSVLGVADERKKFWEVKSKWVFMYLFLLAKRNEGQL